MRVEAAKVVDADVVLELLPRLAALLEEVGPEPDLLQVRLVRVLSQDLLDRHLPLRRTVHAQPHKAEPAAAQQPHAPEVLGEAIAELGKLVGREVGAHVEPVFPGLLELVGVVSGPVVELDGLLLVVLGLTGGGALLDAAGVLLLLPIK